MRKSIVVSMLILAAGCGTQRAQRESATRLAGQISQMQTDLGAMAESRKNIAVARHHVSERLLRSALDTELANADRLENMDREPRRLFDEAVKRAEDASARRAKADEEMAGAEAIAMAETSRIDTHAEELAAAAKLLGRLAEKPNWREQLKFYFHFFGEVKDSLDEMKADADQSETDAASQTAGQATTT